MSDTPTPECDQIAAFLHKAPSHAFQDRDAWERVARRLERERDALRDKLEQALLHLVEAQKIIAGRGLPSTATLFDRVIKETQQALPSLEKKP